MTVFKVNKFCSCSAGKWLITWLILLSMPFASTACAANSFMYYEFAFDMRMDGQHATILDFNLSCEGQSLIAAIPSVKAGGGVNQEGIHKYGPRPTDLYIEWKDLVTGSDFSRNINLRGLLDQNLEGATIYPVVNGGNLSLYLISAVPALPESASSVPSIGRHYKTILIYSK